MKTRILLIALLFLGINSLSAQSPVNSLHFDGTNDYVSTSLPAVFNNIASNDFTIETWISDNGIGVRRVFYAQLNSTEFVSILISSSNSIFAYAYDGTTYYSMTTSATLTGSTWTHLAMTWDAFTQTILIYLNGVLVTTFGGGSSTPSSVDSSMTLGIGYAVSNFEGGMDEFRIWDVVRTECQISGTMNSEFTLPQANLVAYYNFNQGVAGGTNTGITTLPDFTTSYDATLFNFGLTGSSSNWIASGANINAVNQTSGINTTDVQSACDSFTWIDGNTYTTSNSTATYTLTNSAGCDSVINLELTINNSTSSTDVITACDSYTWIDGNMYTASNSTATHTIPDAAGCDSVITLDLTINNSTSSTDVITACDSYTWIDGNTYTASNNTATHTIPNAAGCDSVTTLDLTINSVSDITTSVSGLTITANNGNASYQWLDCNDNYAPIPGENSIGYTPTQNGSYAVEITENSCVDTSSCAEITIAGLNELEESVKLVVYPNPTSNEINVMFEKTIVRLEIVITDIQGKMVLNQKYTNTDHIHLEMNMPSGVYLITVRTPQGQKTIQVIKE